MDNNKNFLTPILSQTDAKDWESRFFADIEEEWEAMQNAGRAIADQLIEDYQEVGNLPVHVKILGLIGKGHNGGDALIMLNRLRERGYELSLTLVAFSLDSLRPLTMRAWKELDIPKEEITIYTVDEALSAIRKEQGFEMIIDGFFGLGFSPPLAPGIAQLIEQINSLEVRTRVSVDTPTGLADEGNPSVAFRSDLTYATGIIKKAMTVENNLPWLGQVRYLDLGFFEKEQASSTAFAITEQSLSFLQKWRSTLSYKKTYGHVFIFAGSRDYAGALLMTAEAALRGGAGLVTAFCPASLHGHCVAALPEVMWLSWEETKEGTFALDDRFYLSKAQKEASAMVVGPGLGNSTETFLLVKEIAKTISCPVVFDASALQKGLLEALQKRPSSFAKPILTPHLGEIKALFSLQEKPNDEQLLQLADQAKAWLLLKGSQTKLAEGGCLYHCLEGHPILARGGSGDILAGLLVSRLAVHQESTLLPLAQGLAWHGYAARKLAQERGTQAIRIRELFEHL